MEAASQLVVDATASHFLERGFDHGKKALLFRLLVTFEQEIDGRSMREFRRATEAAVFAIEELCDGLDLRIHYAEVELCAGARERFRLRDGVGQRIRGVLEFPAAIAIRVGNCEQDAPEAGTAHLVFGRE